MVETSAGPRSGLRILLAHDLSPASELALGLILHATWPPSTVVHVVTSPEGVGPGISSFANVRESRGHARQVQRAIAITHERVAADLLDAGVEANAGIVRGKPAAATVREAARLGADLIVVGARRQGSIEATLLGSVSRAVVERAPCSVLVARSITTRRLLLATDGSAPATFATSIVGAWPMFADARIRLVGVGEGERHFADEAADYLAARGRQVQTEGRTGDVAMELVAAARSWPADLVVLGFSARPILHRLVLGTVARQVVDTVTSSVLVARPHRVTDGE